MFDKLEIEYWLNYATADLNSAKVLLENTNDYHISIYHSHQAIEKIMKRFFMLNNMEFPFIHDLIALYNKIKNILIIDENQLKDLNYITKLYADTRYPKGDSLTCEEAEKALNIAQNFFALLK